MDAIAKAFLADIDQFLQQAGIDPTALGKQAMGDPSFVFDLKKGRSPSTRTMERVRAWMQQQRAAAAPAAPPRPHPAA